MKKQGEHSNSALSVRTLDLGFEKDLTIILNSVNSAASSRQNVLLSATLTHGKHRSRLTFCHYLLMVVKLLLSQVVEFVSIHSIHMWISGVTRLADICLKDSVSITVSGLSSSDPAACSAAKTDHVTSSQSESFVIPEALKQFVVIVPSKVRLVCLAAFILDKCKVNSHFHD